MTPDAACLHGVAEIKATDVLERMAAVVLQQFCYLSAKTQIVYQEATHVC